HRLDRAFGHVTAKLGADAARMHRNAANAAIAPAPVKLYREQHVCGLCATVSHPRLILGALEVRIVEIDIAAAVTGGGEAHESSACAQQRRNLIYEHEVPQVIGAELRLETILSLTERRRHHAG